MNEHIAKLASQSYDQAFDKCKLVKHTVGDIDVLFAGFAMNEMYRLVVKDCVQTLVDHGYTDAATCLTQEILDV